MPSINIGKMKMVPTPPHPGQQPLPPGAPPLRIPLVMLPPNINKIMPNPNRPMPKPDPILVPREVKILSYEEAVKAANNKRLAPGEHFVTYYRNDDGEVECLLVIANADLRHLHFLIHSNHELYEIIDNINIYISKVNNDVEEIENLINVNNTSINYLINNTDMLINDKIQLTINSSSFECIMYWNEFNPEMYEKLTD